MDAYKGSNPRPARGNHNSGGRPGGQFGPRRATAGADIAEGTYVAPPAPPTATPAPYPLATQETEASASERSLSLASSHQSDSDPGWTRLEGEVYNGPMPSYVEAGTEGSSTANREGVDDELPAAQDPTVPPAQPTGAAAQDSEQEIHRTTALTSTDPPAMDPLLAGRGAPLASPETAVAERAGSSTGMRRVPAKRIKLEGSAETAVSPGSQTGAAVVSDGPTSISSTANAENVNASQPTAASSYRPTAAPSAPVAPTPTPMAALFPMAAVVATPTGRLIPQPIPQDPCSDFDRVMDEMMGPGHPHAALFNDIRQFLAPGVPMRNEGQDVIITDEQGNEHRMRANDVDQVQAIGLDIQPSRYEQYRNRRERTANRPTMMGHYGAGVREGQDGGDESEEDSEGDIEIPGKKRARDAGGEGRGGDGQGDEGAGAGYGAGIAA